jgi:hypothetical protein
MWEDDTRRRSLGIREKKILYERAGHKCEACQKEIDFLEMQVGHKKAHAKGGNATLKNTVCICYKCNNLMGTDSWVIFLKKIGKAPVRIEVKKPLQKLTLPQLKFLVKRYGIKVKGRIEEGFLSDDVYAPTKSSYINALAKKIDGAQIESALKEYVAPAKKKKTRKRS